MKYFLVSTVFICCIIFRFYNISWGAPYFFHPDERNIASSVSQLNLLTNMNPHFFAYGSLPIYVIYFLGMFMNSFHSFSFSVPFDQAIIIGRVISALLSTCLIILVYKVGEKLYAKPIGVVAALLAATSMGLLQFAHFATFEMWLTFFSLLLTYTCLYYFSNPTKKNLFFISLSLGLLISIKISSLVLFFPVFLAIALEEVIKKKKLFKSFSVIFTKFIFVSFIAFCVFFFTNPFVFIDFSEFFGSISYETSVATGKLPVFYTEGFTNTTPVLYQFLHVYPFLLNGICTIFFILSFFYILWKTYKSKQAQLFLFLTFFLTLFISQAIFFVKWTRYLVPTIPYICIMMAYTYVDLLNTKKYYLSIKTAITLIIVLSFFYAACFTYFTYIQTDTRTQAYVWAKKHIPRNSSILSEVYDLGIVPFNDSFPNITLFNFYDLDTDKELSKNLSTQLAKSNYIILPSQRIAKSRLLYPTYFPRGNAFYTSLFWDKKRYKKIYQTPCNIVCKIVYNGDPVFGTEETATVFDRPTIYIFKRL
jgi:4-amino-4-deoxy-L-arabinose transferase-like glycosyltransferase